MRAPLVPHKYLGLKLVARTGTVLCGKQSPHTAVAAGGKSDTGVYGYVICTRESRAVRVGARACGRAHLPRIMQYAWPGQHTHVSAYERRIQAKQSEIAAQQKA